MIEVTIPSLFWQQVCTDETPEAVALELNRRETSSARWSLASAEAMRVMGDGSPPVVDCSEHPGRRHMVMVTDWIIPGYLENP